MWNKEVIFKVVTTKEFAVGASSAVSLVVGAVSGYLFTKKKLEKQFNQTLDEEIEKTREYYGKLRKTGDYSDLGKVVEKYEVDTDADAENTVEFHKALVDLGYSEDGETTLTETEEIEVKASVRKNIFDNPDGDFDPQTETEKKQAGQPYIITSHEFMENEAEREQVCLTYYAGDDTLADETDVMVNDIRRTIGDENNLRFGYASNDPSIVYIRNERLGIEYEIVRSNGKYSIEVAGLEIEHSEGPKLRKFREYREYD